MNRKFWKRLGITILSFIVFIYVLFLILPLILNPIIEGYIPQIKDIIKETTGLNSNLTNVKVVTTPKLTAGLKVEKFEILEPNNSRVLYAENFKVKMSLISLLARKIEIDTVQLSKAEINLLVNSDGTFDIEKYFPENEEKNEDTEVVKQPQYLPFGFKLSNHLPNIELNNYNLNITDGVDKYALIGTNTKISDFILNKSIKIKAEGKATLKGREQFSYDVKVLNKIMPELELN